MSKLTNADFKTVAQLIALGGSKADLLNDIKTYISAFGQGNTLEEVILLRLLHGVPCQIHAATTPDSKLYIEPSVIKSIDGSSKSVPIMGGIAPVIPASTVDFQTGTTTGATFTITFPTGTIGRYRRVGLTMMADSTITATFSAEALSLGALADPGTVFNPDGLALGWVDLQCTAASPGRYKTAGSATNVIENIVSGTSRIFGFGSGGGAGGSGDFDAKISDETELATAIAALPNGGKIYIESQITITSAVTLPAGTLLYSNRKKGGIIVATGGSLVLTDDCVLRDIYFTATKTSGTLVQASGNRNLVQTCNFVVTETNALICVSLEGDGNRCGMSDFIGVVEGVAIGVQFLSGYNLEFFNNVQ